MYLGQSLADVLEHLQHLHHVQVAVAVVVLSIVIIVVEFGNYYNTSPPQTKLVSTSPTLKRSRPVNQMETMGTTRR